MADIIQHYVMNAQRNLAHTFDHMDLKNWIRLVAVVGAYAFLRPYLMKLGARLQAREHEKEIDTDQVGKISANSLRGQVEVPEDTDSEGEEKSKVSGADWGKKARKRQRQMLRKVLEADEKRLQEEQADEEDKDIMEHLVDYEEGVDGW